MPTLRQLEYLVALADLRHFGRAAQATHVSQPSLSQQLRALEQRLGVLLVERDQSMVELTPIGRDIAERARQVLVAVKDIRDVARQAEQGAAGTIRFGVTPTLGPYLMSEVISALHRERPGLRLYIKEGIPDEQAMELSRGQLDMLLGPLPIAGDNLVIEPLFRERLRLVAAPDHPLSKRAVVEKADLKDAHLLSLHSAHHLHRQVAGFCVDMGMLLLRDYEGTSLDALRQMAATGLALTILPDLYLKSEVGGTAGVRIVEVAGWQPTRSIAAAWRKGAAYEDTYRIIAECVAAKARALLADDPIG
jgi:LysR family hydrogen peroxide-inducible transcriptional activator